MNISPLEVTVDPLYPVAYIAYRRTECDGSYRVLRELDGSVREYGYEDGRNDEGIGVVVDLDAADEIVGLEIIHIDDPDVIAIARDYTAENGLVFPGDLRTAAGALAS
jgi:hypothetical protein